MSSDAALIHTPLNALQLQSMNPDATILTYTDLYKFKTIQQLFGACGNKIIILYLMQNKNSGHWTCLWRNRAGIHFFDAYGVKYDYELEYLSKQKRAALNESTDYLKNLLHNVQVDWNNITYQGPNTATCGYFVTHRLHNSHLDALAYLDLFIPEKISPDLKVARYCARIGGTPEFNI